VLKLFDALVDRFAWAALVFAVRKVSKGARELGRSCCMQCPQSP
jgi:hypothetical protein